MHCPTCQFESTKVIDSRLADHNTAIRRRRECESCSFRFTTFERSQLFNLMVQKKDGTTEPYDREKLEKGIMIACGKRPVSAEQIREKITELEEKWGKAKTIESTRIGEDVVDMLADIDHVAFIRFASVYKEFKDVESLKMELDKIF